MLQPSHEDDLLASLPTDQRGPWYRFRDRIIISEPLPAVAYDRIGRAFTAHPDLTLILGHHLGDFEWDPRFLAMLGTVQRLECNLYRVKSWSLLEYLPDSLRTLRLGATLSKPGNIGGIARFKSLRRLGLEGQRKGLEVIGELPELEDLELRSITLPDLSILAGLDRLLNLDLKLGGTRDLSVLPKLRALRYLELWMIRGLDNIGPLGDIATLEYLHLESLRQVTALPNMSGMVALRVVLLQNMKGLRNLSPLIAAPALEELIFPYNSNHMQPEDFECLIGHKTLKAITQRLGSEKKSEAVDEMLKLPKAQHDRLHYYFVKDFANEY